MMVQEKRKEIMMMKFQKVRTWLHADGRKIIDEEGDEILLRGQGIGNWMNPEGFMLGATVFGTDMGPFMRPHPMDRGRSLVKAAEELCGREFAEQFWKKWMENYFAEEDIRKIRELGFNSVRLPLSARLFLEEREGWHWNEETFALLDHVIDCCEKHGLYVIIDLHAACGGQSGVSCDDGLANIPYMFQSQEDQERTMRLWEKIAARYQDRWIVAGYELLNEPIALPQWDDLIPQLKKFYDECIARIRRIDRKHMIFLQGNRFASRFEIFDHDYDPECHNWVMTVHLYEKMPDLQLFGPMLEKSEELNVPVWIGETGGSTDDDSDAGCQWMTSVYEMAMEYHMGYNIWAHKAVCTCGGASYLFGYRNPEGMEKLKAYFQSGGPKPSFAEAESIFNELLENIRFENCTVRYDRAAAELRRPGSTVPAACYDPCHTHHGTWKYALYTGFRREDRMHLLYEPGYRYPDLGGLNSLRRDREKYLDLCHIMVRLEEGDAVSYTVREVSEETSVIVRFSTCAPSVLRVSCNGESHEITLDGCGEKEILKTAAAEEACVLLECIYGFTDLAAVSFRK